MATPGEPAPRTIAGVAAAAFECIAIAEQLVDAAIDKHTDLAGLSAMVVSRAAQSLYSVATLAQLGMNGDAMSVARTVVELAIDLAYIATDPATLIPRFTDYAHVREYQLAQAVDRLHEGGVDQDAMRVLRQRRDDFREQNPRSTMNWAGQSLEWRAERVLGTEAVREQYVEMYKLLYADMCAASHSGYLTLKYTLVGDVNNPRIHFGHMAPEVKPIRLAFVAMVQLIKLVCEACEIDGFEDRYNRVNDLLLRAGR